MLSVVFLRLSLFLDFLLVQQFLVFLAHFHYFYLGLLPARPILLRIRYNDWRVQLVRSSQGLRQKVQSSQLKLLILHGILPLKRKVIRIQPSSSSGLCLFQQFQSEFVSLVSLHRLFCLQGIKETTGTPAPVRPQLVGCLDLFLRLKVDAIEVLILPKPAEQLRGHLRQLRFLPRLLGIWHLRRLDTPKTLGILHNNGKERFSADLSPQGIEVLLDRLQQSEEGLGHLPLALQTVCHDGVKHATEDPAIENVARLELEPLWKIPRIEVSKILGD
mmetsp:Transcript_45615/g.121003  ORF Transcript_45615/g.121003 Transcript_45615/m.121003 type:complete len:274 (-) Transcript_45615:413-1234(-)